MKRSRAIQHIAFKTMIMLGVLNDWNQISRTFNSFCIYNFGNIYSRLSLSLFFFFFCTWRAIVEGQNYLLISFRYELISSDWAKKFDGLQIRTLLTCAQLRKERISGKVLTLLWSRYSSKLFKTKIQTHSSI